MKRAGEQSKAFMELLKKAYLAEGLPRPGIDPSWQNRVMASIRQNQRDLEPHGFLPLFGQTVWRLAPATCALALVLGVFTVKTYLGFVDNPMELFLSHAEDVMITQLFGM
jgi:hypothetical protein